MSEIVTKRTFPSGGIWLLILALVLIMIIWYIAQDSTSTPDTVITTGGDTTVSPLIP